MSEKTVPVSKTVTQGDGTHLLMQVCEQLFPKSQMRFEKEKINLWVTSGLDRDVVFAKIGKLCHMFGDLTVNVDVNFHKKITYIGIEVIFVTEITTVDSSEALQVVHNHNRGRRAFVVPVKGKVDREGDWTRL